jgi:hypothetical protein
VTDNKNQPVGLHPDYNQILDDLDKLQKDLLPANRMIEPADMPQESSAIEIDSLKIPKFTDVLEQEIDSEHQARRAFDEAQHQLFGKADAESAFSEDRVNAIVSKLVVRMRPQIEQLLEEKIRAKVIARFNREN